jgi:hypothetical protein
MAMFVWADGTVTGSVNVDELEAIQKGLKGVSKSRLADLAWPIESAEQLAGLLTEDDAKTEPKSAKVKATTDKET